MDGWIGSEYLPDAEYPILKGRVIWFRLSSWSRMGIGTEKRSSAFFGCEAGSFSIPGSHAFRHESKAMGVSRKIRME